MILNYLSSPSSRNKATDIKKIDLKDSQKIEPIKKEVIGLRQKILTIKRSKNIKSKKIELKKKKIDKIKVIHGTKDEKSEKRQGWWSQ